MKKIYLIFGMCDETFSINYTADIPKDVDRGWFMFFVTLLNHIYWFTGATLGGIFGSLITFNTEGLDFVMTAMFMVIFMEQWLKEKTTPAPCWALACRCCAFWPLAQKTLSSHPCWPFLAVLSALRKPLEKKGAAASMTGSHERGGSI